MSARIHTDDVLSESKSFRDLVLPDDIIKALEATGFNSPSPVQQAAIPLGRLGADLIIQAKSGTGKTIVFAVICLERLQRDNASPQVITRVAAHMPAPALVANFFVGGLPIINDEKQLRRTCQVVVGTPGRIRALLEKESLKTASLKLLVLDEVDALLADTFYDDVTWIYDQLTKKKKQVIAVSATYTPQLLTDLEPLMKRPQRVNCTPQGVALLGVRQFYQVVAAGADAEAEGGKEWGGKVELLLRLLAALSFHQAAVFCNSKPTAEWLAQRLTAAGYPSAFLSGSKPQEERMEAIAAVKALRLRVIVSTDVMARGVDLDRVNLVVNMDVPHEAATYMHRVGRTGRFGTLGVAVSFVTAPELLQLQQHIEETKGGLLEPLPATIPPELYAFELEQEWEVGALQALREAPTTTPPPSPPPRGRKQEEGVEDAEGQVAEEACPQAEEDGQANRQGADGAAAAAEQLGSSDTGYHPYQSSSWYDSQYQYSAEDYYRHYNQQYSAYSSQQHGSQQPESYHPQQYNTHPYDPPQLASRQYNPQSLHDAQFGAPPSAARSTLHDQLPNSAPSPGIRAGAPPASSSLPLHQVSAPRQSCSLQPTRITHDPLNAAASSHTPEAPATAGVSAAVGVSSARQAVQAGSSGGSSSSRLDARVEEGLVAAALGRAVDAADGQQLERVEEEVKDCEKGKEGGGG